MNVKEFIEKELRVHWQDMHSEGKLDYIREQTLFAETPEKVPDTIEGILKMLKYVERSVDRVPKSFLKDSLLWDIRKVRFCIEKYKKIKQNIMTCYNVKRAEES